MSISYDEDLYVVDSDRLTCYSPTDMSVTATSAPASVVDFNNDPPGSDPSTLSDVDHMITLDSFTPILENLPGFYLDQNSYYLNGTLTEADWARLRDYTRTVSKFIVTDNGSKAQTSPSVFIRIARLLQPDMPLLPSLSDLVIVNADASIAYLDLLLTPSLKSLKASRIPDAQQSTFSSFLTAIEQEVPLLQTLILGPGQFLTSSLQTISQFNSLRHLELKHEGSTLPFAFFDNIGSLAMLKTFILDARYVSGTMTEDKPIVLPAFPTPSDNLPKSNAIDGNRNEHGAADVCQSKIFNQLATLHVTGWLPLLEDLIHRVTPTKLEDVSVTFIRSSFDELKVSLAKKEAEREEEERRKEEAEKKMKEQEKMLKDEMERKRIDEERRLREEAERKMTEEELWRLREEEERMKEEELWERERERERKEQEELELQAREMMERERKDDVFRNFRFPTPSPFIYESPREPDAAPCEQFTEFWGGHIISESPCEHMPPTVELQLTSQATYSGGKKKKTMNIMKKQAKQEAMTKQEVQERFLKEQERLASLSFEADTESFTKILRKLCFTSPSLKSLSVRQLGGSFQRLINPPTLPEDLLRTMLLLPAIESLEVEGWILDSVEGVLSATEPIPNLKSLLMPLGEPNSGIFLPTLRHVAKTCPKLESFQCYIDSRSPVPEYSIPTDVGLLHGLRILSVGSSSPLPVPLSVPKKLGYLIARHLYLLFPKLETIITSEGHDAELWVTVDEFVKMFQTARMDDLNRQ